MENIIFRAHKEIIPRSSATIHQYIKSLAIQNLRLLKRFNMSIDIKTQQNTICLIPISRLSSSPLNCTQEHLRKIGIIS